MIVNMIGAFGIKGLALVISLLTTPAYLRFFQNESVLGLWFTINSVLAWILNFDLGIGNGLRNHLTKSFTERNEMESRKYISSAYVSVGALCILIAVCFITVFDSVNWNFVFNIGTDIVSQDALLLAVKIVFVGILLQLFFKLINSILYAIQKSSVNNFISLCTSVITLVCLWMVSPGDNNSNVIVMAYIHLFAVISPLLVTSVVVFSRTAMKNCIPHIRYFSTRHAKEVLSLGGMFLFVQAVYMVIMSTNEYLISILCSNEAVVTYQLYYKPFSLGSTVFALALAPIWSAVTKAYTEKDFAWINRLYKKLLGLSAVGTIIVFSMIPFIQFFMDIWLGKNYLSVNYWYAVAFAGLGSMVMINSVMSSFANGIGRLRVQASCFAVGAMCKIPMAYLLVNVMDSWIGVVWANVFAVSIYCLIQPMFLRKQLHLS